MKRFHIYTILFLSTLLACRKDATPVGPDEPEHIEPSLNEITFTQNDYNKYAISHADGANFNSKEVIAIAVGEVDSAGFHVRDSISSTLNDTTKIYRMDFDAEVSFNHSLLNVSLRVRYYHPLGTWSDYDSTFSTINYPYPGTKLVWLTAPEFVEDIDISDSVVYGQANHYILIYDTQTGTKSRIVANSYEVLTIVDNRYVFYDHANWSLYRYDLVTNSTEEFVYHPSGWFMLGLESYGGTLYELHRDDNNGNIALLNYSISGEPLDSIPLPLPNLSRLTIKDGTAFIQDWGLEGVRSYDLLSKTFTGQYKAPAYNYEGLRIRNGYMYFSDFHKRAVFRFPFSELFTHGVVEPGTSISQPRAKPLNEPMNSRVRR